MRQWAVFASGAMAAAAMSSGDATRDEEADDEDVGVSRARPPENISMPCCSPMTLVKLPPAASRVPPFERIILAP